jgi:hypothetical protein
VELDDVARVEIRCCCNPERLYGTLPMYGGMPRHGHRFRFTVPPTRDDVGTVTPGGEVLLELSVVNLAARCRLFAPGERVPRAHHDVPVDTRPALKYHGDDLDFLEKLRRLAHVPGFEPSAEGRALLGIAPARGIVWP